MAEPLYYPGAWHTFQTEPDPTVIASNPQKIPEVFNAFLGDLAPRTVYPFSTVAERDANLARTPGITFFAFTRDTGTLWVSNNGAAWAVLSVAGGAAWSIWTPTWTDALGNTLNYGSATKVGRYALNGKTLTGSFFMLRAATTQQGGTGAGYYWSLPSGVSFKDYRLVGGSAYVVQVNGTQQGDTGAVSVNAIGNVVATDATHIAVVMGNGDRLGQPFKASAAITNGWGPGDSVGIQFVGEVN